MTYFFMILLKVFRWTSLVLSLASSVVVHAEGQVTSSSTANTGQASSAVVGQTSKPEEPEAILRQRVERYWAARQSRDISTVYQLESAAQPGGWLKLENAMTLAGLPLRKVKVEDLQIDGESAKVKVTAEVNIGTIGWMPQSIQDNWILLNGQWFHETVK